MTLTPELVHRIALLARLQLDALEEVVFAEQLGHLLEHFEKLAALDTDTIEPTAHAVAMEARYRDDVVTNAAAEDDLLANAPARDQNFFKVPKIIE